MKMKILIVVVVAVAGIVSIGTAVLVGRATFEGTVVDDPYQAGLKWDAQQKEQQYAEKHIRLLTSRVSTGRPELIFRTTWEKGKPAAGIRATVKLSRPATGKFDRAYAMHCDMSGYCRQVVDIPLPGTWNIVITASSGKEQFIFETDLSALPRSPHGIP